MDIEHIHQPKSVSEAINDLLVFFECDMWYSKTYEWKNEKDMLKYLLIHFEILQEQCKGLQNE